MKRLTKASIATALAATSLMSVAPAIADSPVITASGGQCEAKWQSTPNRFRIRDNDLGDSDYCYVDYGVASNKLFSRHSRPQDVAGYGYYTVNLAGYGPDIYWKVCKERQNDSDICSSVQRSAK